MQGSAEDTSCGEHSTYNHENNLSYRNLTVSGILVRLQPVEMLEPETPEHIRRTFNNAIDRLNGQWNLRLPRYHGRIHDADEEDSLGRKCSNRIRYMCFRPETNLEGLMSDFEDYAKHKQNYWISRPEQASGTFPSLPNSMRLPFGDALVRNTELSQEQRSELLCHLDQLLADECRLSIDSDVYKRTNAVSLDSQRRSEQEKATFPGTVHHFVPLEGEAFENTTTNTKTSRKHYSNESLKVLNTAPKLQSYQAN